MTREADDRAGREPEHGEDFPEITEEMRSGAVRGLYADALWRRSNVVPIDEDLRALFPTERAVNDALRTYLAGLADPRPAAPPLPGETRFSLDERQRAHDYDRPFRTVVIHNDLNPFFPNAEAVNRTLRAVAALVHQVDARRVG
jgi:hypothetical protein